MNPHGFSHLYELFATFTIAYIIIDELSENSFIRQISDKVLKKYNVIQEMIDDVKAKISGHQTSIISIDRMNLTNPEVAPGIQENSSNLESIKSRVQNFEEKINLRIKKNYKTRTFVFLNIYVLMYCLTMLYYGGLYEGLCHSEDLKGVPIIDHKMLNNLDNSLFIFFTYSFIVLGIGWYNDTIKVIKNESFDDILSYENESENHGDRKSLNGYYKAGIYFVIIICLCIVFHIFNLYIINFKSLWLRNSLILATVFLPFTNFIAYFFKAIFRANNTLKVLNQGCKDKCDEFTSELKEVENFIVFCGYIKTHNAVVTVV